MGDQRLLRSIGVGERSLEDALSLGPALLLRAQRDRVPWVAASLSTGPALVLGAAQRAGRVVDLEACSRAGARVLRRATTGTAAFVGGRVIVWTLALPEVSSLFDDASPRTLLNRNVRGFLRGFRSAGVVAHYFGRDWISIKHCPAALLGFDVAPGGEVLIEALAGYDHSIAVPEALSTQDSRGIDRWNGKSPASLQDVMPAGRAPSDIARAIIDSIAVQAGARLEETSLGPANMAPLLLAPSGLLDPVPAGLVPAPPRRVPIGWVEAAVSPSGGGAPRRAWLGGDVLAPSWVLAEIARSAAAGEETPIKPGEIAIEGALFEDLLDAVKIALGA